MEERNIRVAITHGDTNGIGYEVILKAFEDPTMLELCTPIIYGSPKVAAYHRNAMQLETNFSIIPQAEEAREGRLNMLATFDDEVKVELGEPTEESAAAAQKAIARAKEDLKAGLFDVLVQGPVVSHNVQEASAQANDPTLLIMFSDDIRIALVTSRLPLKEVPQAISRELIVQRGKLLHTALQRDFRISNPRIAVLALNPQPGTEEQEMIAPAIEDLEKLGIQTYGPYAADDFFGRGQHEHFDAVLAMYDDQGTVAFKTLAHGYGVKMKTGLPFVITTPDHGPAFDIAGKGVADAASLRHAVYAAIDIFRRRADYDEPLQHPLPKLYHEKREDSDKARFAKLKGQIPPKHEGRGTVQQEE
ncbi:MAG: 4-hydroxythreonine-4-phosphate dehydrogenase PdxA [Prevotella sp.]|nr:4-hydroxythreonine-4-phosphate dehydrogenase PdxA [Prevotella sp.]